MATLTFDPDGTPLEVFHVTDGSIVVTAMAFPAPPLETATSGSIDTEGDLIAARRHQNRTITLTLEVTQPASGPAFRTTVAAIEAKAAKVAREGGELRWVNDDGESYTFDLLAQDGYEPTFDVGYFSGPAAIIQMSLTAKPYARWPEVALSSHSETTLPALIFTEAGIQGDVPALGRLVVTEASGNTQYFAVWGVQSCYYDSDAGADLLMQAEAITAASTGSPSGASNGSAAANTSLTTGWQALTAHIGRHAGQYRVLGRFQVPSSNAGTVEARLAWSASSRYLSRNPPVTLGFDPPDSWLIHDLGTVLLQPPRYGDPVSTTEVEVRSSVAGDDVYLDWLLFVPTAEGSGQSDVRVTLLGGLERPPLKASGQWQILSDGVAAYDSALGWLEPDVYEGDYLRVPVGYGTVRFVVKAARYSIVSPADSGIDDISAQLYYTPRWLSIR